MNENAIFLIDSKPQQHYTTTHDKSLRFNDKPTPPHYLDQGADGSSPKPA
jgi:hypothetical protein